MNATVELAVADRAYETDEVRWQAVQRRDATANGNFVYAVRTTRVYCRPSCASRQARRENVSYFSTPADAEAAGFRACKRCRPGGPSPREVHAEAVARACRLIDEAAESPSLDELAEAAGMSRFHFHRVFKDIVGITPRGYAVARRRARIQNELQNAPSVTAAIYEAGYNASSRFYENAENSFGMAPAAYRQGGHNSVIRFAVGECSLGSILVAATERGVCAVQFGDDPQVLVQELQRRFPRAELLGADREFEQLVARVVGFVEAPRAGLDLPLDIAGTSFQQRVWQALRAIPAGRTASYADIAAAIGAPKSVRAVATACAANPIAVVIPCHRVVRTDGGVGGYRWGVERKRALLDREAAA
ncbi:MAG: bifunctional DNA-binding transcriptional regulator/O6-methylguanine-DNA methyltransferase Ada [Gammaproteobacteria bacterium]|nr:bifunctional DNA-binding transcriptional regulator/O6-methylguanine-DNA methyltransferase Ada [Gammaproteobacteria bacterium]